MFLENAAQLKEVFGIDKISEKYTEFTPLIDKEVGFSVKREYPKNIRYKPPITKNGIDDVVALIHVVYDAYREENSKTKSKEKIPIFVSIAAYSKYLSKHFDYDFSAEECPPEDSVRKSKLTPKPISLETIDEYIYDSSSDVLRNSKNAEVTGKEILDKLFQQHCDTIHPFKGFMLRWKIGSRNKCIKIIDLFIGFNKWVLNKFFGRTFDNPKNEFSGSLKPYKREDMNLLKTEVMDIFGYKASRNVIVTFCFLILTAYSISYKFSIKSQFIQGIITNNLTLICASICSLWLLDRIFPVIFFWIINSFLRFKLKLIFIEFKT